MADSKAPPLMGDVTPATALLVQRALRGRGRRKTTRKKRATRTKRTPRKRPAKKRATRRKGGTPARMVKGSVAAKRHMAKLRRMQKRKRR